MSRQYSSCSMVEIWVGGTVGNLGEGGYGVEM
jgi:hypothetical protein